MVVEGQIVEFRPILNHPKKGWKTDFFHEIDLETLLDHPKWCIWICFFSRYPKCSRKTIIFLGRFLHPKSLLPISSISQFHHLKQQMVKVLGVKPNSAKAKKSAAKIPVQKSHPQSHSPTTRSNTASIRTGKPILDENEPRRTINFLSWR